MLISYWLVISRPSLIILTLDADTGLKFNISKCEIIAENTAAIPDSSILSNFVKVTKDEMTMLGAPVFKAPARMLL